MALETASCSLDDVLSALQKARKSQNLVCIDGVLGAGKTTLGSAMAARLSGTHVDLDDFLIHDQDTFVNALRMTELAEVIDKSARPLVVSGICMSEVLQRLGLAADFYVYVKRMACWGWADEEEVEGNQLEEVAEILGVEVQSFGLRLEVREYHRKHQPHRTSDIVFLRYGD